MTCSISFFQFRSFKFAVVFAAFCIACVADVSAQERRPDRGLQAGNSYAISDIETVNLQNGNVVLNIPLASLPAGKGSSPGLTVGLKYNSKLWDSAQQLRHDGIPDEVGNTKYMRDLLQASSSGGWHLDKGSHILELVTRNGYHGLYEEESCVNGNAIPYLRNGYRYRLELRLPDGGVKEFRPRGSGPAFIDEFGDGFYSIDMNGVRHSYTLVDNPDGPVGSCSYVLQTISTTGMHYFTNDGSNLRLFVPPGQGIGAGIVGQRWTLYYPDGRVVENAPADDPTVNQRITDRNGNRVLVRTNSIESNAGHRIEFSTDSNGNTLVTQKGFGGADVTTTIVWGAIYVYRNYKATQALNANPAHRYEDLFENPSVVEKIILPSQAGSREIEFGYNGASSHPGTAYTDGWGELNYIKMPSEAEVLYDYHLDLEPAVLGAFDVLSNYVANRELKYLAEYDGSSPQVTEVTSYSNASFMGVGGVTLPDGSWSNEYSDTQGVFKGYAYRVVSSNGTISEKIWAENSTPLFGGNPYVKTELSTIPDSNGNPAFTAIKEYEYDKNGNVLEVREYDWVPYLSITRTGTGNALKVTALPSERTLLRKTVNSYYYPTPIATDTTTDSPNHYSNPNSPALLNLIKSTEVRDANDAVVSRSEFLYDGVTTSPVNGNLTETRVWDNTKGALASPDANGFRLNGGNSVSTTAVYDQYGNVEQTTDANNTVTQITYGNVAGPNGNVTGLYPTQTIVAHGTSIARTSTAVYDFYTGLPTSSTDVDNGVTNATEYDALGRPTKAISALGVTDLEAWTQTEYDDINRRVIVRSDLETKGDGKKVAVQHFDQLGRVRLARTLENAATEDPTNEQHGIKVQTRYRSNPSTSLGPKGEYTLVSNPYRASSSFAASTEPTMGWTVEFESSTSGLKTVETFNGSALPSIWGGNTDSTGKSEEREEANAVVTIDESGRTRRTVADALGRMIRVDEPNGDGVLGSLASPHQATSYSYDTLGNLLQIVQGGQTRTFTYSSLSRLLSATNPESGTFQYTYDPNGNLLTKTDARSITTTYSYDALNRVTFRNYSDTTPDITYTYDDPQVPFSKGKLTKVASSVSETHYLEFDEAGRITKHKQAIDGEDYTTAYTYNLGGALIEETYPSGRVVKNVLNSNGDLSLIQSRKNANHGFSTYANSLTYNPAGVVSSAQLGNGRWESIVFNSRLQSTQIALGTVQNGTDKLKLEYNYGTVQNNGNVLSQTITVPTIDQNPGFVATQTYLYDFLNRLQSAEEKISDQTSWKQTFIYDRFSNRSFNTTGNNTTTLPENFDPDVYNPTVSSVNNQFESGQGYTYDASGNTKSDPLGRSFVYDAENKLLEIKNLESQTIGHYFYDGNGKRVKKVVPANSEITVFVYNAIGKLIAEYSTVIAPPENAKVAYVTNDHLGSPRIITDKNGTTMSRRDLHPFGEEVVSTHRTSNLGYADDEIRQRFTSYKRDSESLLDFAEARYYSIILGRFTSPDEFSGGPDELFNFTDDAAENPTFYADLDNPQSLNKYQYTYNNPLNLVDPDGHKPKAKDFTDAGKLLAEYEDFWNDNHNEKLSGKKNYLRFSSCPRCPMRRPPVRRPQPRRVPRSPRPNQPREPYGPGLNEANQRRQNEQHLQNLILVPSGPANMIRFPGPLVRHHIFPQANEFARYFSRAGINIHLYTVQIPQSQHRLSHSGIGQGQGGAWNNQWRQFFRANPNATRDQIFQQANTMLLNFAMNGNLVPYRNPSPSVQSK